MKSFKADWETFESEVESLVKNNWDDLVTCQVETQCCEVNPTVWENKQDEIRRWIDKIEEYRAQIDVIDRRIAHMESECQEKDHPW